MDIKKEVMLWLDKNIKSKEWFNDEWFSLTKDFDININTYVDTDENKRNRVTVYPVINGRTDIELPIEIIALR